MKRIISFLLLCSPLLLHAQVEVNSLVQAFNLAKEHNKDLSISRKLAQSEKAAVNAINYAYLPQFKAVSNLDYNYALPVQLVPAEFLGGRAGEFKTVQFGTKYLLTAGVEASMPLINTSLWADTKIAQLSAEAAEERSEHTEREVLEQVAKGYFLTLLSKKAIEIAEKNLQTSDTILAVAQNRFKNQLIDKLELNRFGNQHLRLQNQVDQSKVDYLNNLRALKYYLGLNQEDSLVITSDSSDYAHVSFLQTEVSYPSVNEKRLRMEAAYWNYKKQYLKRMPEVGLYGRFFEQAQRNEINFFDRNKPWYNSGLAGLRVEIPLFTAAVSQPNIKKARINYEIAKEEFQKQVEQERLEDKQLQTIINTQKTSVERLKDAYMKAEENVALAFFRYKEGLSGSDQYLNVLQETLTAQSQYLNALSELYITTATIQLKTEIQ